MVFFDKQLLFDEQPQAWVNGPVYPSVYQRFKSVGRYMQFKKEDFVMDGTMTDAIHSYKAKFDLTELQQKTLDELIRIYGSLETIFNVINCIRIYNSYIRFFYSTS